MALKVNFSALFFLLLESTGNAVEDIKIWNTDTNFDNPMNWADNRLPCENDRVIFPFDASVVSFVSSSFSIAEMIFPMNGEIVLKEGVSLNFTGGNVGGPCIGKNLQFVVRNESWYDAKNWNITSPRALPSDIIRRNMAVPHISRIPCSTDRVVFSDESSFKVLLDSQTVSLSTLKINGLDYDDEEFQNLLKTHTGKLLFPTNPKILVSRSVCSDSVGCDCDDNIPDWEYTTAKVCSHVQLCPPFKCKDPIKPLGHCCLLCGAYLQMEHELDFQMSKYMDFLGAFLSKDNYRQIDSYTGKTKGGVIQTVFVDRMESKGTVYEVSKIIHNQLQHDIRTSNAYRLKSAELYQSGPWDSDTPSDHSLYIGEGVSSGGVVAIAFIILAIAGAIVAWYMYKKRRIPGFSFARFDLRGGKIELELDTTPHEDLNPEESSSSCGGIPVKGFDNPVYDVVQATNDGEQSWQEENEENFEKLENEDIVENPMFVIFEETSKDQA